MAVLLASTTLCAQQPPCSNTPAYSTCEIVFELSEKDGAAHPNPYLTTELRAEFRSPRHRTFLLPAYWDGGRRLVIRFAPTEPGEWDYRVSSNVAEWEGKTGTFTAVPSDAPGFVRTANVHHWAYTERNLPHLWMGASEMRFGYLDDAGFRAIADARAGQKFNHLRGYLMAEGQDAAFRSADAPDVTVFQRFDQRVRYLNEKGLTVDLILAAGPDYLAKLFPGWEQRRRFVRYIVSRYAAMNVTWQGIDRFEDYADGRALLKEIGGLLTEMDPYQHPRTTAARVTSAPLADDGWMNFATYGTTNNNVGAIEHQLYAMPFVNLDFGREDSGAGKSGANDVDGAVFRERLWNAVMDGQYVTYNNTGSGARFAESPGAKAMTAWYDFFASTRHWELEPYFDVDGGRALALDGVEYVVYMRRPGPIELEVEKHGYDVFWVNPIDGGSVRKKYSGEHFAGEPPDRSHDWVLHVVREGHMESMNRSYKFESREIGMQEIEAHPEKVPFALERPTGALSLSTPAPYQATIKRATRATRSMMYLWLGDVAADGQGYRVLATGANGMMQVPAGIAKRFPATLHVRLYGMNTNGKVYAVDTSYQLNK